MRRTSPSHCITPAALAPLWSMQARYFTSSMGGRVVKMGRMPASRSICTMAAMFARNSSAGTTGS